MRLLTILLSLIVFAGMFTPTLRAQELPKAKRFTNVEWYTVLYVKWKPGKAQEGSKIIHDHFLPVSRALGQETIHYHFGNRGHWDQMYFFFLEEGPGALEWQVHPNNEKFWAEVAKRAA